MNDTHERLARALRAEAREAALSTDTPKQYDVLTSRLDDVDRSRTRTRWLVAAAAAVLVGGGLWAFSSIGSTQSLPPAASTPTPTASASALDPALEQGLRGHWTTWISPSAAKLALAGTAYEDRADEILGGLSQYHGASPELAASQTWQFEMYLDGRLGNVYVRDASGKEVMVDQFDYSLLGGTRLGTATTVGDASVESAVYDVDLAGTSLRLAWVSGSATGSAAADSNEGYKRVLYASTTWTAADGG